MKRRVEGDLRHWRSKRRSEGEGCTEEAEKALQEHHRRTDTGRFHRDEMARIGSYVDTENRLVAAQGRGKVE